MQPLRFEFSSTMPCSARQLWDFHMQPDALDLLCPPGTRVVDRGQGVVDGSIVVLRLGWWPLVTSWRALHVGVDAPSSFTDVALEAPLPFWSHQHKIEGLDDESSRLRDVVHVLPPGWLPAWAARHVTRVILHLLFGWRHRRTRREVADDRCGRSVRRLSSPISEGA